MKAFATRTLLRRSSVSNLTHDSASPAAPPVRSRFNSAPQARYKLIEEKGAAVDSPLFREQMKNANEWALATTTKVRNVIKLLQEAVALETQVVTAKKAAFSALTEVAKGLASDGFKHGTRTLAMDSVQLFGQLSETESTSLAFVCSMNHIPLYICHFGHAFPCFFLFGSIKKWSRRLL